MTLRLQQPEVPSSDQSRSYSLRTTGNALMGSEGLEPPTNRSEVLLPLTTALTN